MKIAYVLRGPRSASGQTGPDTDKLARQLEVGTHGVDATGMFFYDDNGRFISTQCEDPAERLSGAGGSLSESEEKGTDC